MSNPLAPQSALELSELIRSFLQLYPDAIVKEGTNTLFVMDEAQVTIEPRHGRCVLYFWSSNRNLIRTVTKVVAAEGLLKLSTLRVGANKATTMRIVGSHSLNPPTDRDQQREAYSHFLLQALQRYMSRTSFALSPSQHTKPISISLKNAYARGLLRENRDTWAFIGIGRHENASSRTALLRAGLCWLQQCRAAKSGARHIVGLKVVVPKGHALTTQARMSWLSKTCKWELYELEESGPDIVPVPLDPELVVNARMPYAFDHAPVVDRAMGALMELLRVLPKGAAKRISLQPVSPNLLSIRLNGLEFASISHGLDGDTFKRKSQLKCMLKTQSLQTSKDSDNTRQNSIVTLFAERQDSGCRAHPYYRNRADMWLAEVFRKNLFKIEPTIQQNLIYCSVESSSAKLCDSVDLLALDRTGRLIVVHARASAKAIFPLHGLDQWLRIRELNRKEELKKLGYFPNVTISSQDPLLMFVTPALRLDIANESILGCLSPEVEWTFLGVDENWRSRCRVIFRKHSSDKANGRSISGSRAAAIRILASQASAAGVEGMPCNSGLDS